MPGKFQSRSTEQNGNDFRDIFQMSLQIVLHLSRPSLAEMAPILPEVLCIYTVWLQNYEQFRNAVVRIFLSISFSFAYVSASTGSMLLWASHSNICLHLVYTTFRRFTQCATSKFGGCHRYCRTLGYNSFFLCRPLSYTNLLNICSRLENEMLVFRSSKHKI